MPEDISIYDLPSKTTPSTGDKIPILGADDLNLIDYKQLGTAILDLLTEKTYPGLSTGAKNIISAITEVNSGLGNLNVGCENLINNGKCDKELPTGYDGIKQVMKMTATIQDSCLVLTCTDASDPYYQLFNVSPTALRDGKLPFVAGDTLSLTFDGLVHSGDIANIGWFCYVDGKWVEQYTKLDKSTSFTRYTYNFKINSAATGFMFRFRTYPASANIKIKNIVLTKGNVSPNYFPSIADVVEPINENSVYKGETSDLDSLIKITSITKKTQMHTFGTSAAGNPTSSSGLCITIYGTYSTTVSQWIFTYHGSYLYRARSDKTINPWTQKGPIANLTTTWTGSPLDATMGKQLQDSIDVLNNSAFKNMGTMPSDANLDEYITDGTHYLNNFKVDTLGTLWAPLIIITSGNVVTQIIINKMVANNVWVAMRRYSGSPLAWTPWNVYENTGWLSSLQTTDKTSIVSALNEVNANLSDITKESIFVGSKVDSGVNKWFKVCDQTCSGYGNTNIMFAVTRGFTDTTNKGQGILSIQIRSNNTSIYVSKFAWLANSGLNPSDFIIVISGMSWTLYTRNNTLHNFIHFEGLSGGSITESRYTWPLNYTTPNTTPETTDPVATKISEAVSLPASNISITSISGMTATTAQAALAELNENSAYNYGWATNRYVQIVIDMSGQVTQDKTALMVDGLCNGSIVNAIVKIVEGKSSVRNYGEFTGITIESSNIANRICTIVLNLNNDYGRLRFESIHKIISVASTTI